MGLPVASTAAHRRLKRHLAGLELLGPVRERLHEHRGPV
jgi:hypothetical protein